MDLSQAMEVLGYYEWSNRPDGALHTEPGDPGGTTRWGLSQRSYPNVDLTTLTLPEVTVIYNNDYWSRFHCDRFSNMFTATQLFLAVVNMNQKRACQLLQECANTYLESKLTVDGAIGPNSYGSINSIAEENQASLVSDYSKAVSDYYKSLNRPQDIAGWLRRASWPNMDIGAWPYIDENWRPE